MPKNIQLGLYALLCLLIALAIFFFQVMSFVSLLFVYSILFFVTMLFDYRGLSHSVPAGPYSIQALCIYLGMIGLLAVLYLGSYLISLIGATTFFDSVESAQRLQVFFYHLPLLLLTGLLGLLAVLGYLATVRERKLPRFVSLVMDKAFILYVLVGILLASTSTGEKLYVSVAPTIMGDPDILEKQDVYETFAMLDTQLNMVHGYVLQAWKDAISKGKGETLCIAPPGPFWSSESLQLNPFPQSTLLVVNEGTLLLESWQATLEGIELYEHVEATMLNGPSAETFQSPAGISGDYIVCGKYADKVVDDLYDSLELLEEAQQSLNSWIELNGRAPATFEDELTKAWVISLRIVEVREDDRL